MRKLMIGVGLIVAALYLWNASWLAPAPQSAGPKLIAHRGVHQTFDRDGIDDETCTAERIEPPRHHFMENTLASMNAAFEAGADIVEIDVHPTRDGQFAVFHDWMLDCRTEAFGETRAQSMAYLKRLDIGYGYTPDGGRTYPLRGKGVGEMPSLAEVLEAMPDRRFLVNFKSNETVEGDLLAGLVQRNRAWRNAVWGVYGGTAPTERAARLIPDVQSWLRPNLRDCLLRYIAFGWADYTPDSCRNTKVMVPINLAPWLWGWPNRFLVRMRDAGSEVILVGPYRRGDAGVGGVDDPALLASIPADFSGYVWTNRIEEIGPALGRGHFQPVEGQ